MRVLHVLTQLPAKTGSGVYFANLISAFKAAGVENAAIYGAEEKHRDLISRRNKAIKLLLNQRENTKKN